MTDVTDQNPNHSHNLTSPEGVAQLVADIGALGRTANVLDEVAAERRAQDEQWGEQNHPDADPVILGRLRDVGEWWADPGHVAVRLANNYDVPTANTARIICERERLASGSPTWAGIALEEFAEVIEVIVTAAATGDPTKLRTELIQLGAVSVAWVEALDRREKES